MTDGQRLVSFYVDECIAQNRPGMTRMKGHMAKRARELYDAIRETPGYDDERAMRETLAALREFVRRDMKTPMALAELSLELVRNESPVARERPEARRRAKDWIAENGWPTGARFVHGTHSGSYVFDPLGTEPIPRGYDWPYRRPTFDDVVEALA